MNFFSAKKFSTIFLNYEKFILSGAFLIFGTFVFLSQMTINFWNNEFYWQAEAFLNGRVELALDFDDIHEDMVLYQEKIYWPLPPFPAILILPLVFIFRHPFAQNIFSFVIQAAVFFAVFRLLTDRLKMTRNNSLWLTFGFFFATIYINCAIFPESFRVSHAVAAGLSTVSLYEFFGKRRYWLIGVLVGGLFLTRPTAGLLGIYYLWEILADRIAWRQKINQLWQFGSPIFFAILTYLGFNYARFGNIFETGYGLVFLSPSRQFMLDWGLFHWSYIPSNFYYYFIESFRPVLHAAYNFDGAFLLAPPYFVPNDLGATSIFLTAPFLLYLFQGTKDKHFWRSLSICGLIVLVLLSYFYNGWPQVGPRYFIDILPPLFFLTALYFSQAGLRVRHKVLILVSASFNLYLFVLLTFIIHR